ncbi:MAG: GNAT family N-acetyltransferase [Patescibacteria group bacterium]
MENEFVIDKKTPSFSEIKDGNTTKFICSFGSKEVGVVSATLVDKNTYEIGGFFVEPSQRGSGIGSSLVKLVNAFLKKNNSLGKLINTIKGDTAGIYESNNWVQGSFKSHGAYGAYEYIYDGREKS